jgi:hypothetical protein
VNNPDMIEKGPRKRSLQARRFKDPNHLKAQVRKSLFYLPGISRIFLILVGDFTVHQHVSPAMRIKLKTFPRIPIKQTLKDDSRNLLSTIIHREKRLSLNSLSAS